jgi:hypothetical protein
LFNTAESSSEQEAYRVKRTPLYIILGILILLLLLIIAASFWFNARSNQVAVEIPPGGSLLHVGLGVPQNNSTWSLNSNIPLTVSVDGSQPIDKVDLYINGRLYETRQILGRLTTTTRTETWAWQPGTQGDFILVAYATDALGATGISQPLRLHVTAAEGFTTVVTPQAGDTLVSLADAHSAKVEDVVALNPAYPTEVLLHEDV